jgi:hypothetical protein
MKYIYGSVIAIVLFVSGVLTGHYYDNKPLPVPDKPIVATPVHSNPVIHSTTDFNQVIDWLNHYDNDPVEIDWTIKKQTKKEMDVNIKGNLFERQFEQDVTLPIAQSNIKHHIIQTGYIFQNHNNEFFSSYSLNYLYNFGIFAIGIGGIGSNKNIGIQGIIQISL